MQGVGRGEVGVRINQLTGEVCEWREGSSSSSRPAADARLLAARPELARGADEPADGPAPLQSVEGLSLGVDLAVRYALDPLKVAALARNLPDDVDAEIVEPAVQGVVYKVFARYTVREIFSTKRGEIQQAVETELAAPGGRRRLAARRPDGQGRPARRLPARHGGLLAEELASEKMRYTLELKDKRVKGDRAGGEAEKVRREKPAEAAAREQVIAAKAQEEAMKHVLPFKQRQIEQRKLEAEAEKETRMKLAEATRRRAASRPAARPTRATSSPKPRPTAWRRSARPTRSRWRAKAALTRHPLLIQKTLADKLSDKVQVIIAPPGTDGSFLGANLLGGAAQARRACSTQPRPAQEDVRTC